MAEQTIAVEGALKWEFPGMAVSLDNCEFENPVFQDNLASFVSKASIEAIDEFEAKTRKAGAKVSETRNTTNPAIITKFLMTILEVNGSRIHPPPLGKRVRDDVCWDDAELPWRRSPFWLVLRVCIQRLLYLRLGAIFGRPLYKFLMCSLLARLLEDCVQQLSIIPDFSPEQCNFLKTKLCRRLAKLEDERTKSPAESQELHVMLFNAVGPLCQKSIDVATSAFETEWNYFKRKFQRRIPELPFQAQEKDLRLTMLNSFSYIQGILDLHKHGRPLNRKSLVQGLSDPTSRRSTTKEFTTLNKRYSSLAEIESRFQSQEFTPPVGKDQCETRSIGFSYQIDDYLRVVGDSYEDDPEQMSIFILCIFELWMHMDKCVTLAYPLVKEYHPWMQPEWLDVLLLSQLRHMERLQRIQLYLQARCQESKKGSMTIFAHPTPGCFTDRYFDCNIGDKMKRLQDAIETASSRARNEKELELDRSNNKFKDLTAKRTSSFCNGWRLPDGSHNRKGCSYCEYGRRLKRLKIKVHEDFLPSDEKVVHKRAIVFELGAPSALRAYRNTTWNIIATLCLQRQSLHSVEPKKLLTEYSQLKGYSIYRKVKDLTLASTTKSYLDSHYKSKKLPTTRDSILLPLGLNFSYYDVGREVWLKDLSEPLSFAHRFAIRLPGHYSFSNIYCSSNFGTGGRGPSSYEALASITDCPTDISVHEFVAHQNLMGGNGRRWLSILTELGSSNVNFSRLETTVLFRFLALQVGRRIADGSPLATHVFRDPHFCNKLIEQVEQHLEIISSNWRENNYMETLLVLTIQLCELSCPESSARAHKLLLAIRQVTFTWISLLRYEMRNAEAVDTAENAARYCFLSTLLCRRTFAPQLYRKQELDGESFKCFIEVTLAMQESLVVDMSRLSTNTRNMLIRDIKMTATARDMLRDTVQKYPSSLQSAIDVVRPNTYTTSSLYSKWQFLPHPHEWWVTSTMKATEDTVPQVIHYHLLEGHLLIDGHAMGKLPAEIRDSEILKELFGNQRLVAFPSSVPDMSYTLAVDKEGYRIHLGYRKQQLIIRAQKLDQILELVPRQQFGSDHNLDLPSHLIHQCVHWIDLRSGILEIRRQPRIWRDSNWTINISSRRANGQHTSLVDPHSKLFKSIAGIFRDFEEPQMLIVTQPLSGHICVELKRMNLTFYVNKKGLLQCKQLSAEVDPNQDAGTLYGLSSMLVLRKVSNRMQRSIVTTMGGLLCKRCGIHVSVRMENTGAYARYDIDDVLGRLYSPPEPELLYNKAQLHALTSFFIPDPLTGRTGSEEALSCLQSGHCQPWTPLSPESLRILTTLSNLSPRREYYPSDKRCQQIVHWNVHLTTTIQHEAYHTVVNSITAKSNRLSLFHHQETPSTMDMPFATAHLQQRSLLRRTIYERSGILHPEPKSPADSLYIARDRWSTDMRTSNVREIVSLFRMQPLSFQTTYNLENMLQRWPLIGGYTKKFTPCLLEDYLKADIAYEWGGLVNICRDCEQQNVYYLMFQLGLLAFGKEVDIAILRVIAAFFLLDELKNLVYPQYSVFTGFKVGEKPTREAIVKLIIPCCKPCEDMDNGWREEHDTLDKICQMEAERQQHEAACLSECRGFSTFLLNQWPCAEMSVKRFCSKYLYVTQARDAVALEWSRLYANLQLWNHAREVQAILSKHYDDIPAADTPSLDLKSKISGIFKKHKYFGVQLERVLVRKHNSRLDLQYDMETVGKWIREKAIISRQVSSKPNISISTEMLELETIIKNMIKSNCQVKSLYAQDLMGSIIALKTVKQGPEEEQELLVEFVEATRLFRYEIRKARAIVRKHHTRIAESLSRGDSRFRWLSQANLWPCMTPITVLEQLRSTSRHKLGSNMRDSLISYGLEIVKLQQLIRMKGALGKQDNRMLYQEYNNCGHVNWHASDYPDWLLLEVDSNFKIRKEQATVALEIISPSSGSNSVLQMNMGQGKTSVIMPMVASVIAGRDTLARLLVPKSLLSQTAQILQARLGGLLGREITHIPFSRRTPTTPDLISEYRRLHDDMFQRSGIMLGIPEHILSFKLSGLQRLADSKITEAVQMVNIQRWMNKVCHDVLDECDFTLAVRTQLIYPSGSQLMVDGHPDRWEVTMSVLDLVAHHIRLLVRDFPQSIDIVERSSADFPMAYFLRKDVEDCLIQALVDSICYGRMAILPIHSCTNEEKDAIRTFISYETVNSSIHECVSRLFPNKPQIRKNIYLLRGLFARGILLLCLKKRWNVQYGLHPHRDPMAVPFYAKGVPSDQAEWGHPDVAILFTCLSFYYQGISKDQLRQSLGAILKSDDPASEYDRWTQVSTSLPEPLRHWNIINIDDMGQVLEIWRHLRFSVIVINHFLRNFVFPIHAKQFSIKMQASGWDIPLHNHDQIPSSNGKKRKVPGITTGFSGTNDNRRLLPLTIQQQDLPGLLHTNAEVLTYLLQKRNREYILAADPNGRRLSELDLLRCLKQKNIPILIDAGAFILEMDNQTLARAWLQEDDMAQAAVYFGPDNKAWVVYKIGKTVPLLSSPFADNLENCLVYLDEAHTRGTDLKLPPGARGALTLGLNQTKDHTVQGAHFFSPPYSSSLIFFTNSNTYFLAAMRLRQLGTTQSISFISPPEVHQSILDIREKRKTDCLDSSDVVIWLLEQTCANNRDLQPLYYAQGTDFCRRMQAAITYKDFLGNEKHRNSYIEHLEQAEQQTLEQLYSPQSPGTHDGASLADNTFQTIDAKLSEFTQVLKQTHENSRAVHGFTSSALEEVEQEREVAFEVEEEREVQRPLRRNALEFRGLHKSIVDFVNTGLLKIDGAYMKASKVLESTQLGLKHGLNAGSLMNHLYVSREFTRVVQLKAGEKDDNYTVSSCSMVECV